jgi:hypothetical protein
MVYILVHILTYNLLVVVKRFICLYVNLRQQLPCMNHVFSYLFCMNNMLLLISNSLCASTQ